MTRGIPSRPVLAVMLVLMLLASIALPSFTEPVGAATVSIGVVGGDGEGPAGHFPFSVLNQAATTVQKFVTTPAGANQAAQGTVVTFRVTVNGIQRAVVNQAILRDFLSPGFTFQSMVPTPAAGGGGGIAGNCVLGTFTSPANPPVSPPTGAPAGAQVIECLANANVPNATISGAGFASWDLTVTATTPTTGTTPQAANVACSPDATGNFTVCSPVLQFTITGPAVGQPSGVVFAPTGNPAAPNVNGFCNNTATTATTQTTSCTAFNVPAGAVVTFQEPLVTGGTVESICTVPAGATTCTATTTFTGSKLVGGTANILVNGVLSATGIVVAGPVVPPTPIPVATPTPTRTVTPIATATPTVTPVPPNIAALITQLLPQLGANIGAPGCTDAGAPPGTGTGPLGSTITVTNLGTGIIGPLFSGSAEDEPLVSGSADEPVAMPSEGLRLLTIGGVSNVDRPLANHGPETVTVNISAAAVAQSTGGAAPMIVLVPIDQAPGAFALTCPPTPVPAAAVTCTGTTPGVAHVPQGGIALIVNPATGAVIEAIPLTACPGQRIRPPVIPNLLPLLPPPPLQFIPPPPPPLLPPPPPAPFGAAAPLAAARPAFPEVPVIPEADSLFLLVGGLAALGGLVGFRALRRRRDDDTA